ncbi:MAG TPA: response regulator, partial [Methylomirabilota bacterium]|nr:response regulator [Methylomirabilota bacterium]
QIESAPGQGTTVWLRKLLPRWAPLLTAAAVGGLADALAREAPAPLLAELQQQNRELLRALDDLRQRQDELRRLNGELADTNRGVVALYAELDEKADHLRRADEMKSRFLSNMSHEFRTPLNSILALSRLLLDEADGPLSGEQRRQVGYVRRAAEELTDLVNDLLDLAKVEAGKVVVRPVEFDAASLFGALRGVLRPLLVNDAVALVFEEPPDVPRLCTDEAKVSQILRNFISNALKFTERGEVRVSARPSADGAAVVFTVADTGIGIARADQERIFREFGQLENPVQHKVRGTGLGLPLTRKLAELLGGHVSVESEPGVGSTFSAVIPVVYAPAVPDVAAPAPVPAPDPRRRSVLVVEDSAEDVLLYEKYLRGTEFQVLTARSVREARCLLERAHPAAIVLDIRLEGEDTWTFLAELKSTEATSHLPLLVVSAVEDEGKGLALGADGYAVKPVERAWLLERLRALAAPAGGAHVLVIDDDEVSRYLLRGALVSAGCAVAEAASGEEGVRRARSERPAAIFLDLVMPAMSGYEVLDRLEADAATRDIPVVVVTSKALDAEERRVLQARTVAVLSKQTPSREAAAADVRRALAAAGVAEEGGDT